MLWHFFWHEFCDWYLELKKLRFQENSGLNADWRNMLAAFETALRLLHPAMPFLTEELWQRLERRANRPVSIALAPYPQYRPRARPISTAEREIGVLQDIVTLARTLRTEMKLDPEAAARRRRCTAATTALEVARAHAEAIQKTRQRQARVAARRPRRQSRRRMRSTHEFDLVLRRAQGAVDAQRKRLEKERSSSKRTSPTPSGSSDDEVFLSKAPAEVVESSGEAGRVRGAARQDASSA